MQTAACSLQEQQISISCTDLTVCKVVSLHGAMERGSCALQPLMAIQMARHELLHVSKETRNSLLGKSMFPWTTAVIANMKAAHYNQPLHQASISQNHSDPCILLLCKLVFINTAC